MRSDNLKNHMKVHDKHREVEPLPSITSSYIPPKKGSSDPLYRLTFMDQEELLKKLLKCHREYKKKMEMGEQIYEFIKAYDINEKCIPKEMRESLEFYKKTKTKWLNVNLRS